MQVILGYGNTKIVSLKDANGKKGIGILKSEVPHSVGEFIGEPIGQKYELTEQDVVIWFDNIEGARVFQDSVNHTILSMLGRV